MPRGGEGDVRHVVALPRAKGTVVRHFLLAVSSLLWLFSSFCYYTRADWCAAYTFWPSWVWLGAGMTIALSGAHRKTLRPAIIVTIFWVVYAVVFFEEVRGVYLWPRRWLDERLAPSAVRLRVISLNCAGGDLNALREVFAFDPDVALLQESPSAEALRTLVKEMLGSDGAVVVGLDAAVIARGRLVRSHVPRRESTFVSARIVLRNDVEVQATSLRLPPPPLRTDLWSPSCWSAYRSDRVTRRAQLHRISDYLEPLGAGDIPVVCGGDFNAPAGDGVFQIMPSFLHDSFTEGARGWGSTVINDFPVSRFDQIWVSDDFAVSRVIARRTRNSDHRMVICDLVLRHGRGRSLLEKNPGTEQRKYRKR